MTPTDIRDVMNHVDHFGCYAIVQRMGRAWFVDFRGFGFPTAFKTKHEAGEMVSRWMVMLNHRLAELGIDRYGNPRS